MDSGGLLRYYAIITLLMQPAQPCIPPFIRAQVPVKINAGYVVSQVPLDRCGDIGLHLTSGDPHFTVNSNGTIVVAVVSIVTKERSFGVWLSRGGGEPQRVDVQLIPDSDQVRRYNLLTQKAPQNEVHKRYKRRWSPLPFNIIEHDLPPFPKDVELIGSDSSVNYTVYYVIRGPGVTLPPVNLFSVDRHTGMVRVNKAVDREQYLKIVFEAQVFDQVSKKETDRPLDITVLVQDINDNAPTFLGPLQFHVKEMSRPDTEVGVVTATDRDEEGTLHTLIRFSLLAGKQLFNIHPKSGVISTRSGTLDREVQATIPVTVEIRDMNGAKNGLFNTATATITLVDINDNPPTFRQTSYKARVVENKADMLVLRIPVDDRDEERSQNWNAKFVVSEGNENDNFRVDTDPETNEGLLYVVKPLDYEKGSVVVLMVSGQNEVPLVGTVTSWNSVSVELSVGDLDEGPEFVPPNKVIRVKENTPNGTLLGSYTALDPETKSSAGVRYYEVSDPGSWVSVSEVTGELKVTNTIDLECSLVTNAMYNITVKAMDLSSKSGMGTVTLLIEDANDNVPELVDQTLVFCEEEEGKRGWVTVEAHDADLIPYSAPFNFQLPAEEQRKWRLRDAQNTSVVLEQVVDMPRGIYKVPIHMKDLQDKGSVQVLTVRICRCLGGQCVAHRSSVSMGAWGILALLLALVALLLLCLLFVFACNERVDKTYIDDSSKGMLLQSNTEAPGEEVKSANLFMIPTLGGMDVTDSSTKGAGQRDQMENLSAGSMSTIAQQALTRQNMYRTGRQDFIMSSQRQNSHYTSGHYRGANTDALYQKQGKLARLNTWATNGLYLDQKLDYFGRDPEECCARDYELAYRYEGEGSAAGSVGCCSDLADADGLDFLDSLGPKFKTLANICLNRE